MGGLSEMLEHLQPIIYSLLSISLDRGFFILFSFFIFKRTPTDSLSSILDRGFFTVSLEVEIQENNMEIATVIKD
jgi:hypothetical protein